MFGGGVSEQTHSMNTLLFVTDTDLCSAYTREGYGLWWMCSLVGMKGQHFPNPKRKSRIKTDQTQVSAFSTWNFHGTSKVWNMSVFCFFLQAVIWLFLGCEVFNISGFLMDAWGVLMINLLWLQVKRNLVFGMKARARSLNVTKKSLWAGVFKAQVKCCRNELKQKCFQYKSSLISPPVFGTFDLWHSCKVN